jgi:hypothetical protein
MPCFEGLFPDKAFDALVQDLLAALAIWHAYAKLRLHVDKTLESFEAATADLGRLGRRFAQVSAEKFSPQPTPEEKATAARQKARIAAKRKTVQHRVSKPRVHRSKTKKVLNLFTYKWHALGDYVRWIRRYGTTDNYTTQMVSYHPSTMVMYLSLIPFNQKGEQEHKRVKWWYRFTNKSIKFRTQIAKHERRRRILRKSYHSQSNLTKEKPGVPSLAFDQEDPIPPSDPKCRYHISSSVRYYEDIFRWSSSCDGDSALTVTYCLSDTFSLLDLCGLLGFCSETQGPPSSTTSRTIS